MLSSICTTKQYILRLIVTSSWVFLFQKSMVQRRKYKSIAVNTILINVRSLPILATSLPKTDLTSYPPV
jgi:hypothetical protein